MVRQSRCHRSVLTTGTGIDHGTGISEGTLAMKTCLISLVSLGLVANLVCSPAIASAQPLSGATSHPYTGGLGPRASGGDFWPDGPQPHFEEPPGYDGNPMMHPYTSGIGPCPQGTGHTVCTQAIPPTK
jgi:hypothetical protein